MLKFDPEKATEEDIVYLYFNSKNVMISEDFYRFLDLKKVRNAAIKADFKSLIKSGSKKMEIYDELAFRYKSSAINIRKIVT